MQPQHISMILGSGRAAPGRRVALVITDGDKGRDIFCSCAVQFQLNKAAAAAAAANKQNKNLLDGCAEKWPLLIFIFGHLLDVTDCHVALLHTFPRPSRAPLC